MLDHHLQRTIVYRLAFEPSLHFSELKPATIENKLFDYHLKKVVAAGYVEKQVDGTYALTPEGRRLGVHVLETQNLLPELPDSVFFLVIRRKSDGAWLFYKRGTHPLKDRVGFMHGRPTSTEDCLETAHRTCLEKTGLACTFSALGGGYFRIYDGDELESFTHFTLLVCEDARGELHEQDEFAEYYWESQPDFNDPAMLPNMPTLIEHYQASQPFFIERTLQI